jgi:hypothetical protein
LNQTSLSLQSSQLHLTRQWLLLLPLHPLHLLHQLNLWLLLNL